MKQRIKSHFVRRHLSEEDSKKYDHMLQKRRENYEKFKITMISHLSTLNDGVIAIFITVMMLEIPYPKLRAEYGTFVWSITVFLVSFFIIADFWYDNKRIFETIREADHMIVVANFLFLASLALIPATTKWIMNQTDKYSEINFGIVYFVTMLMQQLLYYASVRKRFVNHLRLFLTIILARIGALLVVNAGLMILAWFHPRIAMLLYITLPIISFFTPED